MSETVCLTMSKQPVPALGDCQHKWKYRRVYPGVLELSVKGTSTKKEAELGQGDTEQSVEGQGVEEKDLINQLAESLFVQNLPVRRKPKAAPLPKQKVSVHADGGMDTFSKYQDSVSDAWSTDDPDEPDASASGRRRLTNLPSPTSEGAAGINGVRGPGRSNNVNRYSSEHLRAKGLQRLAMQAQAVSGGNSSAMAPRPIRPGMAVRALSSGGTSWSLPNETPLDSSFSSSNGLQLRSPTEFLPRHTHKADKFLRLLAEKAIDMEEVRKVSWSGIPGELRGRVWRLLCGCAPPLGDAEKVRESLQRKRDEYASLVSEYYPKREDDLYRDTFRQIHIDVPRMCPLVPLFQQTILQELFERVLFIWALRNPASGYVQGINDLLTPYAVVFIRDYLPADTRDIVLEDYPLDTLPPACLAQVEADSFWCLSKLLAGIQNNYTFAQPGIQQRVIQLKDLIQRVDGDLHRHLEKCTVEYLQFTFRWMNNLLIRELPLNCVIRLWDSYHSELDGFANFHVYVCASFLLWWSEDLRQQPDFQHALLLLQNLPTQNWGDDEIERLLAKAFMLKYAFADAPRHLKSG